MRPCPKPRRIVDRSVYARIKERDGTCIPGYFLRNGCTQGLDAHHIEKRGAGGDDVEENMISACRRHHMDLEAHVISPDQARGWLVKLYGYVYP